MIMIEKKHLNEIYENAWTQSLSSLWYPFTHENNFENTKCLFLECLYILLSKDKLKLAKNGCFLSGTIEEQIELFKNSFPNEERMKEVEPYWWYLDECPAGAVWIVDEEVEGFTTPAENGKHYFWA